MPAQSWEQIMPEQVLKYQKPTDGYLCPLNANTYKFEFLKFEVKDYESGKTVFQVSREADIPELPDNLEPELEDLVRSVKYSFPAEFLKFKTIRTSLEFSVGQQPANNFRMIERHYFRGKLARSYDFTFGFCIPNSVNTWESIYDVPPYSKADILDYMSHPFEHQSDSFYFVDNKLVMHNKASYQYTEEQ